jgi:anti-sigma B factor antagonist
VRHNPHYPYESPMARARFDDQTLDGTAHLVVVTGELDMTSTGDLRRRLGTAFAHHARVVIDLSGVTHLDSSGLAELLSAHQRALGLGGGLGLVVTSPAILRTLQIRGVDGLFEIAPTREAARAALS